MKKQVLKSKDPKKKELIIPHFKNEEEESDFWLALNLADYFVPEDFERASFPNLKPTSHPISIRIPGTILGRVKERANSMNVPYQSLIKQYIAQGVEGR